jgi:hypothetical protein
MKKKQIFDIFFFGERSSSRSCHLVLWLLETLTGQQRFYGTELVTCYMKGKILSPLKCYTWGKLHYWFCLKLLRISSPFFFSYNVPDYGVNEHLPTNISYSGVGKYCTNLKGVIFLTLTPVNKFKKFRFLIEEETIFLCLSLSLFLFLYFFFCSF